MSTAQRQVGGRPEVAVARTLEKHRSPERVLALVREAVDRLGGMRAFVRPGQTVLIKPNVTVFYSTEDGCTTDPLVVGALIRLAREAGAARIQVAESSGGFFSSRECMRITGITAVAEKLGAEAIDLGSDDVPNRVVPIPDGRVLREVPLPVPLLDADVVIDVPKAKNHHIEPISGALKNWVGVVNQRWRGDHHGDAAMIGRFMDIMTVSRPTLCVVDAIIVGEGDGPIANLPRWCGCILASTDPVATDVAIARLLRRPTEPLRFAEEAERRGLGSRGPITFLGVPIEEASVPAWPGHEGFDYLPLNLIVGEGVSLEGTIGHVKSVLDSMLRRGELAKVIGLRGTPTIMIGAADDPDLERHLDEGPYVVFDDCAHPRYKDDPRVHFVPGHPVLQTAMPALMDALGVALPGKAVMKWQQVEEWGMSSLRYGSLRRKGITIAKVAVALGLLTLAMGAVTRLATGALTE